MHNGYTHSCTSQKLNNSGFWSFLIFSQELWSRWLLEAIKIIHSFWGILILIKKRILRGSEGASNSPLDQISRILIDLYRNVQCRLHPEQPFSDNKSFFPEGRERGTWIYDCPPYSFCSLSLSLVVVGFHIFELPEESKDRIIALTSLTCHPASFQSCSTITYFRSIDMVP